MNCSKFKTPISYYGGKQSMLKEILPLIPDHKKYVEPFFGGGAVYWAKERSEVEVINDVNANIVNFYEVLKHEFFKLREVIQSTLHSRETYKHALTIYNLPYLFNRVQRAWAFWVVTQQGFATKIGTWGYDRQGKQVIKIANKIEAFKEELEERMRFTTVENNDAVKVIQVYDSQETFIYADPPYVNSDQGHYGGYTEQHYDRLLDAFSNLEGKFLLSSYPGDQLKEYVEKNGWYSVSIDKMLSASNAAQTKSRKRKEEVLTANFPLM